MRRIRLWKILAKCCVVMLLVGFSGLLWAQQGATESLAGKYRSAMELYEKGNYVQARKLLLSVKESIEVAGTKVTPETIKAIDAKLVDIDAKLKPAVEKTTPVVETAPDAEAILAPIGEERVGDVSNVLFCNGAVSRDNGEVFIYYASSDTRMHVATTTVDRLVDYIQNTPPDGGRSAACVDQRMALIERNLAYLGAVEG